MSALVGDDSVILAPGCLGDAMEDEELFEDEQGPDLSLDRHIAKVKFTKGWQEHSKKHATVTYKRQSRIMFLNFLKQVFVKL